MQNNLKKPGAILAAALLVFFTGGFLLLVHIGASGRTAPARHYAPGYRGASVSPEVEIRRVILVDRSGVITGDDVAKDHKLD